MYNTVLYNLRSAKNIGLIARSHIAFGGENLIIIAPRDSWKFNGGQHSYTRQLEDRGKLLLFETFEAFVSWNKGGMVNVGIEIDEESTSLAEFVFPEKCNLFLGGETGGIPKVILHKLDTVITIPQAGAIGSVNVAQAAAIVQYSVSINLPKSKISGNKFVR